MRHLFPAILIPAICMTLAADSTGRIAGRVTAKDGKPVANAVLVITRLDINWTKEVKPNDKGTFMQVGLEAKEFKVVATAPGYVSQTFTIKIPLGDTLTRNITLLTTAESAEEAIKSGKGEGISVADSKYDIATAAWNAGREFYNDRKYEEALPFMERAVTNFTEAAKDMKDAEILKKLETQIPLTERIYGIVLFEVGKSDPAKKDLLLKAEPYLAAAYAKAPKDQQQRLVEGLLEVAKAKEDAAAIATWQAALDAIIGPRPELAYNNGVNAFNQGKYADAKRFVDKAIATDPKFADSYWLLGVVEYSLEHPKAAKEAFKKYMEIAPTGHKSGEVKEFLKELK